MKKNLLLIFMGAVLSVTAQNVTENKVSMNFIQLPTNVIAKQYTFYDLEIVRAYETANDDSLAVYQAKLESASAVYEAQLAAWKDNVASMKRDYLTQMANWQKANNAGTPSSPPNQPVYPAQPVMEIVAMPQLHNDITDPEIGQIVNLAGFNKGAGGAMITVTINPISNLRIIEAKKGTGSQTKYNYTCKYNLPLGLKVTVPGQGVILQTIVNNGQSSYKMKSFSSSYEHELWMLDNQLQFWTDLEKQARAKALASLNQELNNKCGFPVKSRVAEVYTVKKFKEHNYADLITAYTIASQGYKKMAESRNRNEARGKLLEAIAAWKKILDQSTPADKKSRINDKVTALLQCNIAEAYIWLNDYDQAEVYINHAKSSGVNKFKKKANQLDALLKERRLRWNAYFG